MSLETNSLVPIRCSVFMALSLDGFIARPDDGLDWLPQPESGEDYGYTRFIETVDTVLMGRNTFEQVLTFPEYPYADRHVVVLTTRPLALPAHLAGKVQWMQGEPAQILARLAEQGARHVYVDGGETVRRFLRAGLIQEMILTRVPVLLGRGIPLFGDLDGEIPLEHVETVVYPHGLVQSRYRVLKKSNHALG